MNGFYRNSQEMLIMDQRIYFLVTFQIPSKGLITKPKKNMSNN